MAAISQMEMYIIETLRTNGLSDAEILEKVKNKEEESLNRISSNFDYQLLFVLYEKDPEVFRKILEEGYRVKFLTLRGLYSLLSMKFSIEENQFVALENGLKNLEINEETLQKIEGILSPNWCVNHTKDGYQITLKP